MAALSPALHPGVPASPIVLDRPAAVWPLAVIALAHTAATAANTIDGAGPLALVATHAGVVVAESIALAAIARRSRRRAPTFVHVGWATVALAITLVVAQCAVGAVLTPFDPSDSRMSIALGAVALLHATASAVALATIARRPATRDAANRPSVEQSHPRPGDGRARVFVSHSSRDREFVDACIVAPLRLRGVNVWYSKDDIASADLYEPRIQEALEACDWLLVVVSRDAAASQWVRAEVMWACRRALGRVIPVVIDDTPPEKLNVLLISVQHLDYNVSGAGVIDQVARLCAAEPGMPTEPTATVVRQS